jgi:hypothetical protein
VIDRSSGEGVLAAGGAGQVTDTTETESLVRLSEKRALNIKWRASLRTYVAWRERRTSSIYPIRDLPDFSETKKDQHNHGEWTSVS